MSFDLVKLFVVVGGSVVLGVISFYWATTTWQRAMSVSFLAGFMFYSGIGAAYPVVPWSYLLIYFGFVVSFVIAFKGFCVVFLGFSRHIGRALPSVLYSIDRSLSWVVIVWAYVGLHIIPLLYPEIRLYQLLSPPSPDLIAAFARRWQVQEINVFVSLLEYAKVVFTPFFYVALFRYRSNIPRILLIFMTLFYLQYLGEATIGRGTVLMGLMIVGFALWMRLPRYRIALVVGSGLLLPIFLATAYWYSIVRIGGTMMDFSFWRAFSVILVQETSFLVAVGMSIIEGMPVLICGATFNG